MKAKIAALVTVLLGLLLATAPSRQSSSESEEASFVAVAQKEAVLPAIARRSALVSQVSSSTTDTLPEVEDELGDDVETIKERNDHETNWRETNGSLVNAHEGEVFAALEKLSDRQEQISLLLRLAKTQAKSMSPNGPEWLADLSDQQLRRFAVDAIAREWGKIDLDATWTWIEQLSDESLQAAAVSGVVWNFAQQDFETTTDWISEMEPSKLRDAAALKAAKILAVTRPQRAVNWAAEFPEGTLQDDALTYGLHQWTAVDLDSAAGWAIELKDEGLQSKALPIIAAAWANSDPQAAMEWAGQFPDGIREKALELTTQRWLARNSDSVMQSAAN
ncbi:MAG: hypothetical protein ACPGVU_11705 [Limisphaerales bacterium]